MPRGVYDRTKTPEQRAAEKSLSGGKTPKATKTAKVTAKAPKAAAPKKGPKAPKVMAKTVTEKHSSPKTRISTAPNLGELDTGTKFSIIRDNISTLVGAVQGLTSGSMTTSSAVSVHEIVSQLDDELKANIGVLSGLRRDVFGLSESEQAAKDAETAAEAVSAAPVETEDSEEETEAVAAAPVSVPQPVPPVPAAPYPQGMVPMPTGSQQ